MSDADGVVEVPVELQPSDPWKMQGSGLLDFLLAEAHTALGDGRRQLLCRGVRSDRSREARPPLARRAYSVLQNRRE